MTAPRVLVRDTGFDRARAKRDGYTDAEIDSYLSERSAAADPFKPTTPRMVSDATTVVSGKPTPGTVYGNDPVQLARAVGQGATLGFGDELEAAVRAPFSDRTYGDIVQDVRGQNRAYSQQHPAANALAQLGGGAMTGGAIAKVLGGAPQAAEQASLIGRVLQGAKTGAKVGGITGAVTGAGTGETMRERALGAAVGGGGGAVLGGAVGAAAEGLTNADELIQWVRDVAGRTTGDAAKQRALAKLATDLERGSLSPDQIRQQLAAIPEDVPYTLLDVGGANVRDRGMAVAAVPGKGKDALARVLSERRGKDGARVVEAFKRATGATPDEVNLTASAMESARAAAADQEYAAARKAGAALLPQEYRDLMNSPTIRKVYGEITDQLAEAGKILTPIYEPAEIIAKDGTRTMGQVVMDQPNVETLDYVYRHLRDKAESAAKLSRNSQAQQYLSLADRVRGLLDDPALGVPEFTQARQNFASASRRIDARRAGKDFRSLQPEEISATVREMGDDVAPQYRAGGVRKVFEEVQQRGNRSAVSKVDANDQQRAQNLALAGRDTDRGRELATRLDAEKTMADTYGKVLTGSRTTPLKEAVDDLGASQWDRAETMLDVLATEPTKAGLVKRIKDGIRNVSLAGRGEVAAELGDMLSQGATSRVDLQRLLDSLTQFMATTPGRAVLQGTVGPRRSSALAGYSTGRATAR